MKQQEGLAATVDRDARLVPPSRRGSRDERREATLRALAAGEEAHCAYCGELLPPIPPRGGRPTPYCPADPERYGQWGAKTVTCAMLDEHREIWVQVYGPDQPMTHLDVHTLDERLAALRTVLEPVREEVAALQARTSTELTVALQARATAEDDRRQALEQARAASAERDQALTDAATAREQADAARTEQDAAEKRAAQAAQDRDQAIAERNTACQQTENARTERQHALDQVNTAQQRITELQRSLASERAATLEQLDQRRQEEEQARESLRATLNDEWEQRLRAQTKDFDQRLQAAQTAADHRIAELTEQLSEATRGYAASLAPLHDQLATVKAELAEQVAAATTACRQLDTVRQSLTHALADTTTDDGIREKLQAALDRSTPTAGGPGSAGTC